MVSAAIIYSVNYWVHLTANYGDISQTRIRVSFKQFKALYASRTWLRDADFPISHFSNDSLVDYIHAGTIRISGQNYVISFWGYFRFFVLAD